MAEPLSIRVIQSHALRVDDRVELEVDGQAEPDQYRVWGPRRHRVGFGRAAFGRHGFGRGVGIGFGRGLFGRGRFGQGAAAVTLQTRTSFVAADYSVRSRAVDHHGNAGAWSAALTVPHRPDPPAPTNLAIDSGDLTWSWSDPA